jgi:hypothetical protein
MKRIKLAWICAALLKTLIGNIIYVGNICLRYYTCPIGFRTTLPPVPLPPPNEARSEVTNKNTCHAVTLDLLEEKQKLGRKLFPCRHTRLVRGETEVGSKAIPGFKHILLAVRRKPTRNRQLAVQ